MGNYSHSRQAEDNHNNIDNFLEPSVINDSNQKNSIDKDIEKDGLKVDGNILQVLSDIQEVTEEFSSTLLVRDDGSSESTIGRYQGFFKLVTRKLE